MTHNSPSEIESVRERLDKLDEERQRLSDLISQLKEMRDAMTAAMAGLEQKQGEAEKWSNDLKSAAIQLDADGHTIKQDLLQALQGFQNDSQRSLQAISELLARCQNDNGAHVQDSRGAFDQIVQELQIEFSEKSQNIEKLHSDLARAVEGKVQDKIEELEAFAASYKNASIEPAQSLAEKLNNAISELHKAFNLRANEFDERLEKLNNTHSENLEQINDAYQQIYVAYQKLQSSVDAMEISLEGKTQAIQRQSGEVAEIIQAEQENNELRITAISDSLKSMMEDSLGKLQQQIQGKVDDLEKHDAELQDYLQSRDQTVESKMQQMWLGVMLSAIIALVAFILSRF